MNVNEFITTACAALTASGTAQFSTPRLDAELLLCHTLQCSRTWLFTWPDYELTKQQSLTAQHLLKRRLSGEPVAYITGTKDFWGLSLQVNASTLIPRPDTERLVEAVLELYDNDKKTVLDLGTGTGAIALAIATERPMWQITGVDIQPDAIALAKKNADLNGVNNVTFTQSRWFDALMQHTFDIIVSNPPYIAQDDPHLNEGDVRFEPRTAHISGKDGLEGIRTIIEQAPSYLNKGGWVILEHGYQQGKKVHNLFQKKGFSHVNTFQDLSRLDRVTQGQYLHE